MERRGVGLLEHSRDLGGARSRGAERGGGEHVQEAVHHRAGRVGRVGERTLAAHRVVQAGRGLPADTGLGARRHETGERGRRGDRLGHDAARAHLGPRAARAEDGEQRAELRVERHLDRGLDPGRERVEHLGRLLGARRLRLDRVDDRAAGVRVVERGEAGGVPAGVGREEGGEAPRIGRAALRQQPCRRAREVAEAGHGQHEPAEHPGLGRPSGAGVLGRRVLHRQRGRREEARVVDEAREERAGRGRRGRAHASSHERW
ncbi:MAG: hypothetical protein U0599_02990 [Vicinamibacteria bacterium]